MDDFRLRRFAAPDNRERPRPLGWFAQRPDRLALWAVMIAVVALVAGAASAKAGSGGLSSSPSGGAAPGGSGSGSGGGSAVGAESPTASCPGTQFGRRTLQVGDCGDDVETLNWLLAAKRYRPGALVDDFKSSTANAVRAFQRDAAIRASGVVGDETAAALVRGMVSQLATYYGPGFFGNETACGQTLTRRTVGVAHKTLPCGSRVVIRYRGSYLRTRVIDRGPFTNGAKWDLTQAAARMIGLDSTDEIRVATLGKRGG